MLKCLSSSHQLIPTNSLYFDGGELTVVDCTWKEMLHAFVLVYHNPAYISAQNQLK